LLSYLVSRPGKALDFVALGVLHKTKVGIRVAARRIEVQAQLAEALAKPVLEMEFLVGTSCAHDEFAVPNRLNA